MRALGVLLLFSASLADLRLLRVIDLHGDTHHVQGIDLDGRLLWVTSVNSPSRKGYLHEFALDTGKPIRTVEVGRGERFHPGGMTADQDSLWIAVAEYRKDSSSFIQRRSKRTLETEFQFDVADHIGCVTLARGRLIGGNWDSRQFYEWDLQGREIGKVANPTENAYQDLKFVDGHIVASGVLPDHSGAIDWLEYPSLRLVRRITAGQTSRRVPYTREGMTFRKGRLFLLPEDAPSRLFVFELSRRMVRIYKRPKTP
jgi:hypothetical protein